jgi:hypothetical protein
MTTGPTFSRLRAANPVSHAPETSSPELFARIVAQPPENWLGEQAERGGRRRVVAVAIALVVMVVLASTAFAISRWVGGDVVRPPVTKQEYLDAQQRLRLPPGVRWPSFNLGPPNTVTNRGAGGGRAVLVAQNAWECYWVRAIDNRDVAAQRRAHAELNALLAKNILVAPKGASENWSPPNPPKVPYTVFASDGGLQWIRKNYADAAAGRTQNLRDSCRANAP